MTFDRVDERSIESPCPIFARLLAEKHCHVLSCDPAEELPAEQSYRHSGQALGSERDTGLGCSVQNGFSELGAVSRTSQRHATPNRVLPAEVRSVVILQIEPALSSLTLGPKVVEAHPARDDCLYTRVGWREWIGTP